MTAPPRLTDLNILVVDDEPGALSMVKRLLELCDCSVITADNAADALEAVKRVKPDVLISDIRMPSEDGYALLAKVLRSLPPAEGGTFPAIPLTAFARSEDRRRAMLSGFQMHMGKPVESAELVAVVANVAGLTMRTSS